MIWGYYSGIKDLSLSHPMEINLSSRRKKFQPCHTLRKTSTSSMKNLAEGMRKKKDIKIPHAVPQLDVLGIMLIISGS